MFTSTDSSGNEVLGQLVGAAPELDPDQPLTPKGPTGLLQALISASSGTGPLRDLPLLDATGITRCASPFDYDAALAIDLDDEPVEA
jgi:hypothetical protein